MLPPRTSSSPSQPVPGRPARAPRKACARNAPAELPFAPATEEWALHHSTPWRLSVLFRHQWPELDRLAAASGGATLLAGEWGGWMQVIDPKGSFLKNLVLSLLLIGLSSLLIPIVLKQIDDRKAVDQLRFQDEVSRQDTILDAQAALLD